MKKITAMLLAAALLFALSVGCCSAFADDDTPLAELHLEKNGHPLDLTLKKLELEDGNIVVTIGMDGITGWKDEEPPKLVVSYDNPTLKFKTSLFTAETVKSLPATVKNFKTTMTFPYDGEALPDKILIDLGEEEPLLFWPNAEDDAGGKPRVGKSIKSTINEQLKSDSGADEAMAEAQKLFDAGEYYEAALAIDKCRSNYPKAEEECDALWDEIAKALKANRPETGKLIRTMQYEGRNELRLHAAAGDLEVIATDIKTKDYARYYIRKGDSTTIYLPRGEYSLEINIGDLWFDDVTGFGTFGVPVTVNGTLDMSSSSDGTWATYTWYEYTI